MDGGEAESPETEGDGEDQGKHANGAGGTHAGDGNGPGGSQSGSRTTIAIADERALTGPAAQVDEIAQPGGGSSPVLPILIAVAVLAALSIGVVVYRQRRQTPVG